MPRLHLGAATLFLLAISWANEEAPAQSKNIWMSAAEIAARPTTGEAWNRLLAAADSVNQIAVEGGHNSFHDVYTMAAALVAERLNESARRQVVANSILAAVEGHIENDGNSLSLSRSVTGYIIAADLIDLHTFAPATDSTFRDWLEYVVYQLELDGTTQVQKHLIRGNNHGTQAGVLSIAAAIYLEKTDELNQAAAVFKGWVGDRNSYAGFNWGDLCWQVDPNSPVGILPLGSTMVVAGEVRDVDGVQPDDQRRAACPDDETSWPPSTNEHVWGGLQGAVGQAYLLSRAGFDAWNWENQAVRRAIAWQHDPTRGNAPAQNDELWTLPLADVFYNTEFWDGYPVGAGKQVGWTDWTHGGVKATQFTLRTYVTGAGSVAVQPPGPSFVPGTLVELTAQSAPGWVFLGWDNDLTGVQNPATITMDAVTDIVAVFGEAATTVTVSPAVTTGGNAGDAHDAAIWIHPTDPSKSVVIGTDNDDTIYVWDLSGNQLQSLPQGTRVENVDARTGFQLGGQPVDIVAANLRDIGKLAVFKVNPNYTTGDVLIPLADLNSSNNDLQLDSYGFCLYKRNSDGALFVFERPKDIGALRQYLIQDDGTGNGVTVSPVRDLIYTGDQAEGFVADDELGFVYIAEEGEGIHKYHADPQMSSEGISFFASGDGIVSERKGLALYPCSDGTGYLILSSQGNSTLKIYERQGSNQFVKTVVPLDNNGANGIETEGLDVTPFAGLPNFPNGFLIVHDAANETFHFYDWAAVAESDLSVCVNGAPTPQPDIAVNPTAHDFGEVLIGSIATQTFVVTNAGNASLTVTNSVLFGDDEDEFVIQSGGAPFTLPAADNHSITVQFAPNAIGATNIVLRLVSNDPDEDPFDVSLSGTGMPVFPQIGSSPTSHNFGSVAIGEYAETTLTVLNTGPGELHVSDVILANGGLHFEIITGANPFTIVTGDTHHVTVRVHPQSEGELLNAVRIISNDPVNNPFDIDLTCTGFLRRPQIAVTPNPFSYGSVFTGNDLTQEFTVSNTGDADLSVSSVSLTGANGDEFTIENGGTPFNITPSQTHSVAVIFHPTSAGEKSATLQFLSNDEDTSPFDVNLSGIGVTPTPMTTVFTPVADSYVSATKPTTNFGSVNNLRAKLSGPIIDSYLKFIVNGIGGSVQSARLRLFVTQASSGGAMYSVSNDFLNTAAPWTEADINFDNAPAMSGSALSTVNAVNAGEWAEFDVTAAVTGNGTVSFGLKGIVSTAVIYSSKEGANSPELVIDSGGGSLPVPNINSFSPPSGPVGTSVTISGSNFSGATNVSFNGVAANFSVVSMAEIHAIVPADASDGAISVTTPLGTANSATNFDVTISSQPPTISSFNPTNGPVGVSVTISGSNFTGATSVSFNGIATTFTEVSANEIHTTVPAGASDGPISVTTPDGTATSISNFVITAPSPTIVFNPAHDTYVNSSLPTSTFGSTTSLRVRNASTVLTSYLKFEVADLSNAIQNAKLRLLVVQGSNSGGSIYSVSNDFLGTSIPWTESALNQTNAPLINGSPLSTLGSVVAGEWVEFDVTAAISGNGTFSFGIKNSSTTAAFYSSKEGSEAPQLVVNSGGPIPTPPSISSFTPDSGPVGTSVTITGSNFNGATNVSFSGVSATFTEVSANEIHATVPAGASDGPISVTTPDGTANSATIFDVTVTPQPPSITSFNPTSGPVGSSVTITGSNFSGATNVSFSGVSATFTEVSANEIHATVPVGASNGLISVTTPDGTANSATNFDVTVVPQPPSITLFNPTSGPVGSGVTITGSNFSGASNVSLNGVSATFTEVSANEIHATVPAGASNGPISVTTPDGTANSATNFDVTVTPQPPSITSFNPTSGPVGSSVTITGSNFSGVSNVSFNGVSATFTEVSANEIHATVPAGASDGPISVTTPDGTASSATNFDVTVTPQPPSITSFNPTSGPVGSGVTITGSNFSGVSNVSFNGVSATFTEVSANEIRATVPAGASDGPISVTTANGTAFSGENFDVITSQTVTVTFNPTDDSYVNNRQSTSNFGSSSTLRVRNSSTILRSYLKFVVSGVSGFVQSAKLRLFLTQSNQGGAGYSVSNNYEGTSDAWSESGLSWSNAPVIGGSALGEFGNAIDGWVEVDVTAAITGDGTFSFAITTTTSSVVYYSSKENSNPAELSITWDSLPPPSPAISSFSPSNGAAGSQVTVFGENFNGASEVTFNNAPATSFLIASSSEIRADVPGAATSGRISVTTPGGTATSGSDFTVTLPPAPGISSFTPASGPVGTTVTVNGSNFGGATSVSFNGVAASFTAPSSMEIRATVPAGATDGPVSVTSPGGTATSADHFDVTASPPSTTTFIATEDSYVRQSSPTATAGSATTLRVRKTGSETIVSYLKFEVTGFGGSTQNATLRLFVADAGSDGGEVFLVSNNYEGTSTPWVQTGLNWSNAPAISGSAVSVAGSVNLSSWIELDVSPVVNGDGVYSFAIRNNASDLVSYNSRESSNQPELVITGGSGSTATALKQNKRRDEKSSPSASAAFNAEELPVSFRLGPNYPNPFNLETTIEYGLPEAAQVSLSIFNVRGQKVRALVDSRETAGVKRVRWDGYDDLRREVASGLYFVKLSAGNREIVQKLTLQK
jgi:myo-inositol-hexaphosphate 3-phosphohydrolase